MVCCLTRKQGKGWLIISTTCEVHPFDKYWIYLYDHERGHIHMSYTKKILKWLPYSYFFIFFLLIIIPGNNLLLYIIPIPFVVQLIFHLRYLDEILGVLSFILSMWLMLAYASDLHKITVVTNQTRTFVTIGGLLVVANFVMCALLFRNALMRPNKLMAADEVVEGKLV